MGWESDQDTAPEKEPRDWGKLVWVAVFGIFVAMIAGLLLQPRDGVAVSQVFVKHILIPGNVQDPAMNEAMLEKVTQVQAEIKDGKSFSAAAEDWSEDPDSNTRGGSIGWVDREELTSPIDDYIWTAPLGVISEPIATQYGYHLVLVTDRQIADAELYERELQERVGSESIE